MESNTGGFVWYELMTTDPKAAIKFYGDVIGWKAEVFKIEGAPTEPGQEPYHMWIASQGPLGGVATLPELAKKMGAPPHWQSNVTVANLDATIAKVKELGGNVIHGPEDVPTIGRLAVIADPQGGVVAAYQPANPMAPHDTTKQGEFSWNELLTTDHQAAFKFYSALFGWEKISEMDMGPAGTYLLFGQSGKQYGGMMTKTPDMAQVPTAWVYYIQVDDLEGAIKRATDGGAKLMMGPVEVPGGTRIAQFVDPQGAFFALHAAGAAKAG